VTGRSGIGIDIVEIGRIVAAVKQYKDKFLDRVFTTQEIAYCRGKKAFRFPELAARFAAKEAYSKAIGTGIRGIKWTQIEVRNEKSGRPRMYVKGRLQKKANVSLSHSKIYATAVVMVQ
jgi:holo-[acyl-carrier protein] synthase